MDFATKEALRMFIPFATSCLREAGFSAVAVIEPNVDRRWASKSKEKGAHPFQTWHRFCDTTSKL